MVAMVSISFIFAFTSVLLVAIHAEGHADGRSGMCRPPHEERDAQADEDFMAVQMRFQLLQSQTFIRSTDGETADAASEKKAAIAQSKPAHSHTAGTPPEQLSSAERMQLSVKLKFAQGKLAQKRKELKQKIQERINRLRKQVESQRKKMVKSAKKKGEPSTHKESSLKVESQRQNVVKSAKKKDETSAHKESSLKAHRSDLANQKTPHHKKTKEKDHKKEESLSKARANLQAHKMKPTSKQEFQADKTTGLRPVHKPIAKDKRATAPYDEELEDKELEWEDEDESFDEDLLAPKLNTGFKKAVAKVTTGLKKAVPIAKDTIYDSLDEDLLVSKIKVPSEKTPQAMKDIKKDVQVQKTKMQKIQAIRSAALKTVSRQKPVEHDFSSEDEEDETFDEDLMMHKTRPVNTRTQTINANVAGLPHSLHGVLSTTHDRKVVNDLEDESFDEDLLVTKQKFPAVKHNKFGQPVNPMQDDWVDEDLVTPASHTGEDEMMDEDLLPQLPSATAAPAGYGKMGPTVQTGEDETMDEDLLPQLSSATAVPAHYGKVGPALQSEEETETMDEDLLPRLSSATAVASQYGKVGSRFQIEEDETADEDLLPNLPSATAQEDETMDEDLLNVNPLLSPRETAVMSNFNTPPHVQVGYEDKNLTPPNVKAAASLGGSNDPMDAHQQLARKPPASTDAGETALESTADHVVASDGTLDPTRKPNDAWSGQQHLASKAPAAQVTGEKTLGAATNHVVMEPTKAATETHMESKVQHEGQVSMTKNIPPEMVSGQSPIRHDTAVPTKVETVVPMKLDASTNRLHEAPEERLEALRRKKEELMRQLEDLKKQKDAQSKREVLAKDIPQAQTFSSEMKKDTSQKVEEETWAQPVRELISKWPRVFSNSSFAAKERLSMAVDKGDLYELTESLQNAEEALQLEDKEGIMATVDRGDVSEVADALQSAKEASQIGNEAGIMATVDRGDVSEVAEALHSATEASHIGSEAGIMATVDRGDVSEVAEGLHNATEDSYIGNEASTERHFQMESTSLSGGQNSSMVQARNTLSSRNKRDKTP